MSGRIITLVLLALLGNAMYGEVLDKDQALNQNIKAYLPIYCTQKKIPVTYWRSKYEFVINLVHDEKVFPRPSSDIKNMFLGYKNRDTKVKVTCNRLDPAYDRILGTYDLGVFDVKEFGTVIPFNIPDQNYSNKLDIYLAIKRDMLDIEVTDSGKFMGMFKSYGPSRVLNIDFRIVPK